MDVSPVSFQPVASGTTIVSGPVGDSARGSDQATPVVLASVSQNADASKPVVDTQAPSAQQLAQAVRQVNDSFTQGGQNLYAAIEYDKATGIDVVKIVDKNSNETIVQYPSKAILEIAQALQHSQGAIGQLIHDKA